MADEADTRSVPTSPTAIAALQTVYDRADAVYAQIDDLPCCKETGVKIRRDEATTDLYLQTEELRRVIMREMPQSPHDACIAATHLLMSIDWIMTTALQQVVATEMRAVKLGVENLLVYLTGQFDFTGGRSRFLTGALQLAQADAEMRSMKEAA
jgi:hypothetical protein